MRLTEQSFELEGVFKEASRNLTYIFLAKSLKPSANVQKEHVLI
jgi:hypothetical protein